MTNEELMEKYLELQEQVKEKDATIESLSTFKTSYEEEKQNYDNEIKRLQEANMNLFLRVSQEPVPATGIEHLPGHEEPAPVQDWDSFMADF